MRARRFWFKLKKKSKKLLKIINCNCKLVFLFSAKFFRKINYFFSCFHCGLHVICKKRNKKFIRKTILPRSLSNKRLKKVNRKKKL